MAERFVFAVPGSLATLTGGYQYDAKVLDGLRQRGYAVEVLYLGEGFPVPDEKTSAAAGTLLLDAAAYASAIIIDGLALGVLPDAARRLASKTRLIALVHHPLAHEYGLLPETAARLFESEKRALASASHVITTSGTTARLLEREYGVEQGRLSVARPGTEPGAAVRPSRPRPPGPMRLLSVAALSPRKGFDVLVDALAGLKELDWRLTIAGDETRSPHTASDLRHQIERAGLTGRISLKGAVASGELQRHYQEADLFVLASHYEGYGMAYAEALAYGLPIIGTTGGAIPEVVPQAAGILVTPGDVKALEYALRRLIADADVRAAKAAGALCAAQHLPRWTETVGVFDALLSCQM